MKQKKALIIKGKIIFVAGNGEEMIKSAV